MLRIDRLAGKLHRDREGAFRLCEREPHALQFARTLQGLDRLDRGKRAPFYLRHVGPYGPGGGVPATWHRLRQWAEARDLWTNHRLCLGIAYDDPTVTDPGQCRYDACIAVAQGFRPDDLNIATVPGGKVAATHFSSAEQDIVRVWHDLFGWLPQSGFQPDDRPFVEVYRGEAMDAKTGAVTCDLCLPIKPL
jgi:AraC family transcriptional regulator